MVNDDLVGTTHDATSWPLVHLAFDSGTRIIGEVNVEAIDDVIPVWCVPVRFDGRVVAVMVRLQGPLRGPASLYEQAYLSIFERLCADGGRLDVPVSRRGRRRAGPAARRGRDHPHRRRRTRRVRDAQRRQRAAPDGHLRAGRRPDARRTGTARARRRTLAGVRHPGDGRGRPRSRRGDPLPLRAAARAQPRDRRRDVAARRLGPSSVESTGPQQGGGRSRGPPPREEQSADDLVTPATAGAPQ